MRLPADVVARIAAPQLGAVTRAQLLEAGADGAWVTRQVEDGRWQRLHRGVMVTHSGPVPWRTRAWAALLYAGRGACLSHTSAGHLHDFRADPPRLVEVIVPGRRRVMPSPGIVVRHRGTMPPASGRPRRTWPGDTLADLVATASSDDDAVGWVCDAVRAGVRPGEVLDALERRGPSRGSSLLRELLTEAAEGVESALELRYRRDVARRHGLPPARLQVRHHLDGGWVRADAVYEGFGLRVELDGAFAHPGGRTDADTWRDNVVLLEHGDLTLRYRWFHVAVRPCATAAQVATALRARGWRARPRPCSPTCPAR